MGCARPPACDEEPVRVLAPRQTQSETNIFIGRNDPYAFAESDVLTIDLARCEHSAPTPMRIHSPREPGAYAVVLFQHGFMARNSAYDEILRHLTSHGFIVVAPQMYEPNLAALLGQPTADDEARLVEEIVRWLPEQLPDVVNVRPLTDRLGIAGHSRGGKVAWLTVSRDPSRFGAIAGVDPVDGTGGPFGNQPRVINGESQFAIPALVIGTELGHDCAPAGDNHVQFYAASASPAWHIVVPGQGHADMLDEPEATDAASLCPSSNSRDGMRRLTAGLLVVLFRGGLQGDDSSYEYFADDAFAPIAFSRESR